MYGYKWVHFAGVNGSLGIDRSLGVHGIILPPFEYSYCIKVVLFALSLHI